MNLWKAILMGIVQGITEFLPISSSGHLTIMKNVFGMKDVSITFDLMLHFGTLIAIFIVFWKDIKRLIVSAIHMLTDILYNVKMYIAMQRGTHPKTASAYRHVVRNPYRKFTVMIILSTIPTGIIGYTFEKTLPMDNMGLIVPGICLFITAGVLLVADRYPAGNKKPSDVTYTNAFALGIVQGVATLPGISRSGSTIAACLLSGFDKRFAVRYSFIMSIPAVLGAVVLKLGDMVKESLDAGMVMCYSVGTVVSAVVGFICIHVMLKFVREKKYKYFAFYCIIVGLFSIGSHFVIH